MVAKAMETRTHLPYKTANRKSSKQVETNKNFLYKKNTELH